MEFSTAVSSYPQPTTCFAQSTVERDVTVTLNDWPIQQIDKNRPNNPSLALASGCVNQLPAVSQIIGFLQSHSNHLGQCVEFPLQHFGHSGFRLDKMSELVLEERFTCENESLVFSSQWSSSHRQSLLLGQFSVNSAS